MPTSTPGAAKFSFSAVTDEATRVLILGSLPGEASLRAGQYYAHPQNQFWRLMSAVTGRDLQAPPYPERLAGLLSAGVGLWDTVRSAERVGSLDAKIRGHTPNSLGAFAATLPSLRVIAFNGAKASAIGRGRLGADSGFTLITLPSSSPAHAVPFERKLEQWVRLRPFLPAAIR
jgi:hypoxanthine-DNA glycosylase